KTDNYRPMEDAHSPFVSLLQDPGQCCSSGVYVRGGIPLESAESAEGRTYETRQRYTLCRCGLSQNKPFCDASHVSARWIDGLTEESKD
ncbi:MAG: CDGSH iron-sulfur domain-containing protein, partial [Coriobacteriales bacterium]|nr:CDGSH iron-sulfur domain-containing protein [Coriobacteriales bacterium]